MKWAPWVIVIYMLAALCWWTYLLYNKNEIIYKQQESIIELTSNQDLEFQDQVLTTYNRQKYMIIGEGLVFTFALISGVFYLWMGYKKNMQNSERQNNFLLSVTHELKSPIASIKLAFETMKKRQLNPAQNKTITENGITEIDRLHQQVENILVATSIEQRYYVQNAQTSLIDLLGEIKTARRYSPHEERVTYEILGESPKQIEADINGVIKISENLISNALKYSDGKVKLELRIKGKILQIVVSDEGPGILLEERKLIFDRFYRIGNEETRSSKGTGLGLFIVKHIAMKNNGDVSVTENHPKGSIFTAEMKIV